MRETINNSASMIDIPFNKPYMAGKELQYMKDAIERGKISGNGYYTGRCHEFFQSRYGFKKCLLTTSCTDALEMAAILLNIEPGDEVIMPSYTFVSTANAFVLRGAKVVFCDSRPDHPNMDETKIEALITDKTRAIVVVHYAGMACKMDDIMAIANRHGLFVVEDAAQAIDSYFIDEDGMRKPLGGIGHLGTFSFHETKNIICGEGGMLVVNDERFEKRAEIIWEKGTNRAAFFRGEVDKYGWVDIGSSFLMSELNAAFLFAQLECLDEIQTKRLDIFAKYLSLTTRLKMQNSTILKSLHSTNNGHIFFVLARGSFARDALIQRFRGLGLHVVFHYSGLHQSLLYTGDNIDFENADMFSNCLIRLPLFVGLDDNTFVAAEQVLSENSIFLSENSNFNESTV